MLQVARGNKKHTFLTRFFVVAQIHLRIVCDIEDATIEARGGVWGRVRVTGSHGATMVLHRSHMVVFLVRLCTKAIFL